MAAVSWQEAGKGHSEGREWGRPDPEKASSGVCTPASIQVLVRWGEEGKDDPRGSSCFPTLHFLFPDLQPGHIAFSVSQMPLPSHPSNSLSSLMSGAHVFFIHLTVKLKDIDDRLFSPPHCPNLAPSSALPPSSQQSSLRGDPLLSWMDSPACALDLIPSLRSPAHLTASVI